MESGGCYRPSFTTHLYFFDVTALVRSSLSKLDTWQHISRLFLPTPSHPSDVHRPMNFKQMKRKQLYVKDTPKLLPFSRVPSIFHLRARARVRVYVCVCIYMRKHTSASTSLLKHHQQQFFSTFYPQQRFCYRHGKDEVFSWNELLF